MVHFPHFGLMKVQAHPNWLSMMIANINAALAVCFATMLGWALQAQVAPNGAEAPAAAELAKHRRMERSRLHPYWLGRRRAQHGGGQENNAHAERAIQLHEPVVADGRAALLQRATWPGWMPSH